MAAILIIDKRAARRRFLSMVVEHKGHVARAAHGGDEALDMIRAAPPDLVLIDVLLPASGGYQFLRRLRSEFGLPPPRVVFLAAPYMAGEARLLALACGVAHLVPDISDADALLTAIDAALAAPAPGPQAIPAGDADGRLLYPIVTRLCDRVEELERCNARLARKIAASAARLEAVHFALDLEIMKRLWAEQDNRRLHERLAQPAGGTYTNCQSA